MVMVKSIIQFFITCTSLYIMSKFNNMLGVIYLEKIHGIYAILTLLCTCYGNKINDLQKCTLRSEVYDDYFTRDSKPI